MTRNIFKFDWREWCREIAVMVAVAAGVSVLTITIVELWII